MKNEVFSDKRLLGALDYIDERFIAEVTESYTFEAPGEYKRDKKTVFKAYRQFAALAACLILISAAFPIVNYVLPRLGISIGGSAVAGTSEEIALNYTAPFGEVPEEFRRIVEQNLFYRATVYRDRLIKIYKNQESENSVIELLTFDGETVAKIEFPKLTYGYHRRTHMTDDGNLLVVFGLGPVYPEPMHPYYPPATIIKIDLDGNILNEIRFDEEIETAALEYCFSTPEGYVLVGQVKKKDAPAKLYEYDVIVTTLDKNLNVTNQLRIGEDREHNNLSYASYVDGCLHVWKRSLIDTGEGALKRKEEFSKFVFDSKLDLIEETVSDERIDIEYDVVRDERYNKYSEKANLDDACGYEPIEYADFDLIVAEFHTASEHKISLDSNDIDPINLYRLLGIFEERRPSLACVGGFDGL